MSDISIPKKILDNTKKKTGKMLRYFSRNIHCCTCQILRKKFFENNLAVIGMRPPPLKAMVLF